MSSREPALALALAALLLSPCAPARPPAPDPAPEPEAPREQSRAVYHEGLDLAKHEQWAEAYGKFVEAQKLYSSPVYLFNIGVCQRALGRYVGALGTFKSYLAAASGAEHEATRELAGGYVTELEGRVARLTVAPEPADSTVAIDGQPSPSVALLDPGQHTIRVEHDGYRAAFVDRALHSGDNGSLPVQLELLPATLAIDADVRGALVMIDGARKGLAPWQGELPGGSYQVQIRADGYASYDSRVTLRSGGRGQLHAQLVREKPSIVTRWWFWTALGATATGIAVGTYFAARREPPPAPYSGGTLGWVVTQSF